MSCEVINPLRPREAAAKKHMIAAKDHNWASKAFERYRKTTYERPGDYEKNLEEEGRANDEYEKRRKIASNSTDFAVSATKYLAPHIKNANSKHALHSSEALSHAQAARQALGGEAKSDWRPEHFEQRDSSYDGFSHQDAAEFHRAAAKAHRKVK